MGDFAKMLGAVLAGLIVAGVAKKGASKAAAAWKARKDAKGGK